MATLTRFIEMSRDERLAFFQKCQDLMIKVQPDSPWILRENQAHNTRGKAFFLDACLRYQGFVYEADGIIIMFNKHFYENKEEPIEKYADYLYDGPHPTPNTYAIDFIAAEIDADKLRELQPYFKDDMKYITYLRSPRPSVFNFDNFKKAMESRHF